MRRAAPIALMLFTLVLSASFFLTSGDGAEAATRQRVVVGRARFPGRKSLLSSSSSSKKPVVRRVAGRLIRVARPSMRTSAAGSAASRGKYTAADPVECGNGIVVGKEECDDGNTLDSDGCSASCEIETGYICGTTQPSYCWTVCGDGQVAEGVEKCDDGNGVNGDGCSRCIIDVGYKCDGSPSTCTELFPVHSSSSSSASS